MNIIKTLSTTLLVLFLCSCASQERAAYTTLGALGKAVDISEREYLDGSLTGFYKTNNFPRIQASYSAFQGAYKLAVTSAMGSTNVPPTADLQHQANQLLSDLKAAMEAK